MITENRVLKILDFGIARGKFGIDFKIKILKLEKTAIKFIKYSVQ